MIACLYKSDCIWSFSFFKLVCLDLSEHKNGGNFPDSESIAVSALKALWIILLVIPQSKDSYLTTHLYVCRYVCIPAVHRHSPSRGYQLQGWRCISRVKSQLWEYW